jgi:hypothetical protein
VLEAAVKHWPLGQWLCVMPSRARAHAWRLLACVACSWCHARVSGCADDNIAIRLMETPSMSSNNHRETWGWDPGGGGGHRGTFGAGGTRVWPSGGGGEWKRGRERHADQSVRRGQHAPGSLLMHESGHLQSCCPHSSAALSDSRRPGWLSVPSQHASEPECPRHRVRGLSAWLAHGHARHSMHAFLVVVPDCRALFTRGDWLHRFEGWPSDYITHLGCFW